MRRFNSVQIRHLMIHKNQVIMLDGNFFDRFLSALRGVDLQLQRFQQSVRDGQVYGIVVYNQYLGFRRDKFVILVHYVVVIAIDVLMIKYHREIQRIYRFFQNQQIRKKMTETGVIKIQKQYSRKVRMILNKRFCRIRIIGFINKKKLCRSLFQTAQVIFT